MQRSIRKQILEDLKKKIVFIVGPRQVGKTWLAKDIMHAYKNPLYLNYDNLEHRNTIKNYGWLSDVDLVVFDELHKMPKWKTYIKGVFDTKRDGLHILVTGSARMDAFRKAGDSLAGRFFVHHLLPFSLAEIDKVIDTNTERIESELNSLDLLLERSGFPEPLLATDGEEADRWRLAYTDTLLRQDVLEFEEIEKVNAIRQVYTLLASKVGSPISYKSISEDVGIAPATAKRYIEILEALYIIFIIRPYTHKIARAILKEPKVYFFDYGLIGDQGARFENLVALALYKHVTLKTDEIGREHKLGFLKTKENKEVDFALSDDQNNLIEIVEAKLSDKSPGGALEYFSQKYKIKSIQVVKNLDLNMERSIKGVEIRSAEKYLKTLEK